MRRRRIGQAIELRKAKKEDQLLKRRNITNGESSNVLQESNVQSSDMAPEEIFKGNFFLIILSRPTLAFCICHCIKNKPVFRHDEH